MVGGTTTLPAMTTTHFGAFMPQGCAPEGAAGALSISSFAEDLDGELYLLDYGRGELLQLQFTD